MELNDDIRIYRENQQGTVVLWSNPNASFIRLGGGGLNPGKSLSFLLGCRLDLPILLDKTNRVSG